MRRWLPTAFLILLFHEPLFWVIVYTYINLDTYEYFTGNTYLLEYLTYKIGYLSKGLLN